MNGLVVGKKVIPKGHKYPRTYIGELVIMYQGASIHITPDRIKYNNNKEKTVLKWKQTHAFTDKNISIFMEAKTKIFIRLGDNIVLAVLRHLVTPNHRSKVNFLGMYIVDEQGLSEHTHGLIGMLK